MSRLIEALRNAVVIDFEVPSGRESFYVNDRNRESLNNILNRIEASELLDEVEFPLTEEEILGGDYQVFVDPIRERIEYLPPDTTFVEEVTHRVVDGVIEDLPNNHYITIDENGDYWLNIGPRPGETYRTIEGGFLVNEDGTHSMLNRSGEVVGLSNYRNERFKVAFSGANNLTTENPNGNIEERFLNVHPMLVEEIKYREALNSLGSPEMNSDIVENLSDFSKKSHSSRSVGG